MTALPASPRPAHPDDVPAVEALVAAAYGHYVARIGTPPLPMVDDYPARVAASQLWVVDAPPGEPGPLALVVLVHHADHLEIDNVAVAPSAQGRGLGTALLAFAREQAFAAGLAELRLVTNELMTENQALYEHLGWVRTGRVEREGRRAFGYVLRVEPDAGSGAL